MIIQAAPITAMVLLLSGTWYVLGAHKHYKGPRIAHKVDNKMEGLKEESEDDVDVKKP